MTMSNEKATSMVIQVFVKNHIIENSNANIDFEKTCQWKWFYSKASFSFGLIQLHQKNQIIPSQQPIENCSGVNFEWTFSVLLKLLPIIPTPFEWACHMQTLYLIQIVTCMILGFFISSEQRTNEYFFP